MTKPDIVSAFKTALRSVGYDESRMRRDYEFFDPIVRFVTAKIFMDRADAKGWDGLKDPLEILKAAERHTGLLDRPESDFRRKRMFGSES